MKIEKILVVRFSSIGDVLQALSIAKKIGSAFPEAEIHWMVREDLKSLVELCPEIHRVHTVNRNQGLVGLLKKSFALRQIQFSHVYDAHNNLRSQIFCAVLRFGVSLNFLRRPVKRWKRFLLFQFRVNRFETPFSGQRDLLAPLAEWGLSDSAPTPPVIEIPSAVFARVKEKIRFRTPFIALAPSAAYELKRWPLEYWVELVQKLPNQAFVVLGGPGDQFLERLNEFANVQVLAGQLDLSESLAAVALSQKLVANDTGVLHMAEQLGHPCVALMGPAPFGFPSRPSTKVLQLDLPCRPCSKHGQGPCLNPEFHQCLRGILPNVVVQEIFR